MAITTLVYDNAQKHFMSADINLLSDTINLSIITSSYTPSRTTDEYWSQVSAYEATADDYSAVGLGNIIINVDTTGHEVEAISDNITWPGPTYAIGRYLVIYKVGASAETSPLICYVDLGEDKTIVGVEFGAEGFYKVSNS